MPKKIKNFIKEIEIPKGLEVEVKDNEVHVKAGGKEVKRRFARVNIEKKESKIIVRAEKNTKREKKQINTIVSHINNMFKGINEEFVYKLQICSVHFPMNVTVHGGEVIIKNFLGETRERKAKILHGVEVKIDKDIITVSSSGKEAAGQTAANIEKKAQTKNKDRRIFQDGIFLVNRAGKEI